MSDKRFVQGSGINAFNGNELIVKGALESKVGLMAGYPGSPVAEVFTILEENAEILRECGLWAEMTNDESQGAAALNGALDVGVNAVAVMKSVGLNVAADPINIINYADKLGLSGKRGGALVVCGDDPHASSTQVAGDSRQLMQHLKMPVMEPSTPQELKDWIGEALKLSIFSNLVVGYLITTYLAEGGGNVAVYENQPPEISFKNPISLDISKIDIPGRVSIPPNTWDLEKEIIRVRFPKVNEYVRQNKLNKLLYSDDKTRHRIGFVAAGISYSYLEQALWELGCDKQFPLLKLAVTFPVEPEIVEQLAGQVDNIIVVEEKSPFIENQIKGILRDLMQEGRVKTTPQVYGKAFPDGDGFPEEGGFTPSMVIEKVGRLVTNKQYALMGDSTFFWRGITSISNSIKEGQDILYIILDNKTTAMTGHQPTPASGHNIMGDKTVAQDIEGIVKAMGRPKSKDSWDRVSRLWNGHEVYVKRLPPSNRKRYMTELDKAFEKPGVKVVIADKECGITFHRRKRAERAQIVEKQGFVPHEVFVNISQEVCENCRECTKGTGCPGLTIIDTDYGEKIGIDQSTCISDTYCTKIMACPSFENVIVTRSHPPRARARKIPLDDIPQPTTVRNFNDTWNIYVSGVGGMGVGVTASTLARAGTKAGYNVRFNDKMGLAIRNGAVSAHISFAKGDAKISTIVPNGKADLLLGIDMLEAERSLIYASHSRTSAVVNTSRVPTIPMLAGMMNYPPDDEDNIQKHTNSDDYFGGRIGEISELVFGNKLFSNTIMLGVAFQKGLIPVSEQNLVDSIMETVSPKQRPKNMEAFRLGRKLVADPSLLDLKNIVAEPEVLMAYGGREDYNSILERKTRSLQHAYWQWWKGPNMARQYRKMVEEAVAKMGFDDETNKHLARRLYDLILWDGPSYAQKYLDRVEAVFKLDRPDRGYAATKAVIRNLHKVMAVKDEFFTAQLLTDDEKLERDKVRYNIDEENGDRISYVHINEPEFYLFGRQIRFDLPKWLARNWFYNIGKRAGFTRKLLSRWGWHEKEQGFRDWYYNDVIGFYLETAGRDYDWALRGLRVLNDPYRPDEFIVTGFREFVYPKMEKARKQFEQIRTTTPGQGELPVMPAIAARSEL